MPRWHTSNELIEDVGVCVCVGGITQRYSEYAYTENCFHVAKLYTVLLCCTCTCICL